MREGETVTPLELFFDLVFVLALTQCTALMADEPTWAGIGKALVILGVLWWAWVGYSWLTSVVDPEAGAVRLVMFAAMGAMLIASRAVPDAFGDDAFLFACAYAFVRIAHLVLYAIAGRGDRDLLQAVAKLAVGSALGIGLLFVAAGLDGVEAFYVTHDRAQTELLVDAAAQRDLLTTGSADFHGPEHRLFSRFGAFELYGLEPRLGPIAVSS